MTSPDGTIITINDAVLSVYSEKQRPKIWENHSVIEDEYKTIFTV